MKIGIVARPDVTGRLELVKQALKALDGETVVLQDLLADALGQRGRGVPIEKMDADLLVTFGGDGTILHTLMHTSLPVMGINDGEVGFLTEAPRAGLEDALRELRAGHYVVEPRLKLDVTVDGHHVGECVNEVVMKTPRPSKILAFDVFVDGTQVETVRADGMIVATPTGSTSYALSAGGPLLDPRLEGLILVPLAPFRLGTRPLVVPSRTTITIVQKEQGKECVMALDGQVEVSLAPGSKLNVTGAREPARFVRFRPHFYARVRELLG